MRHYDQMRIGSKSLLNLMGGEQQFYRAICAFRVIEYNATRSLFHAIVS